ncbi:DUF397 domain-containing protein [Kibdelosporangium persicum]|nr:DUF397 domain-containing protein [Kibdelosporangium persicum]
MTVPTGWRKSSRSQNGGNCVEVRADLSAVRDSKNPDRFIRGDVRALARAVQGGFSLR